MNSFLAQILSYFSNTTKKRQVLQADGHAEGVTPEPHTTPVNRCHPIKAKRQLPYTRSDVELSTPWEVEAEV
jgi:hypothetical protein